MKVLRVLLICIMCLSGCIADRQCDVNSEIYTILLDHHDEWLEKLRETTSFRVITSNGERQVVRSLSDENGFFVIIETGGFNPGLVGEVGYFYSQSGELSFINEQEFNITYLDNNVWCYDEK